jgi:hypothetical protein
MKKIKKGSLIRIKSTGMEYIVTHVYKNFRTTGLFSCPPVLFEQKWYADGTGIFPEQDIEPLK